MIESEGVGRDLSGLVVPCTGRLVATDEERGPYRLLDSEGTVVKQRRRASTSGRVRRASGAAGAPNPVTGKPALGDGYAPATVAHSETVLRGFYDFHREAGTGPILNPFPLDAFRRSRRAHAHHNPMEEWKPQRVGRYRPKMPRRILRAIPDEGFNELFAALPSNRDRALVALWISTGARASDPSWAKLVRKSAGWLRDNAPP